MFGIIWVYRHRVYAPPESGRSSQFWSGGKSMGDILPNLQHLPLLELLQRRTTEEKRRRDIKWSEEDRSQWFIHAEFTWLCFDLVYQICCRGGRKRAAGDLLSQLFFLECKSCTAVCDTKEYTCVWLIEDTNRQKWDLCEVLFAVFSSTTTWLQIWMHYVSH